MNEAVLPNAPVISPFAPDSSPVSNVAADWLARSNMLRLSGTAVASSIVSLFDGAGLLGLAKADTAGAWSFFTGTLSDGIHSFRASATDADGNNSDLSAALTVVVDTRAPAVPIAASFLSETDNAGGSGIDGNVLTLVASADAHSDTGATSGLLTLNHSTTEAITHERFFDTTQSQNEGHFPVNTIEQALGSINDTLAPTLGELSGAVSNALQLQPLDAGGSNAGGATAFTLDTASTVTVANNAPGFTADIPVSTESVAAPVSSMATVVDAGARWNSRMRIRGRYPSLGPLALC